MATVEPQPPEAPKSAHRRSPWLWVSLGLAVAVIALAVWGLKTSSDLDSANQKVDQLQAQVDQKAKASDTTTAAITAAAQTLATQLGVSGISLDAAKQQVEAAKAKVQQGVADSDAALAAGCARAYLAAFSSLFSGDSVRAQLPTVVAQVSSLTADCKAALSG